MAFAQRPIGSLDLGSRQIQAITSFITNTHKFSTAHSQRRQLSAAASKNQNQRGFALLRAAASEGATSSSSVDGKPPPPQRVPSSTSEIVDQAYTSIKASWEAGIRRQRVELVLPLIGATDLDDWPGGIRQMFKAGTPLIENLLRKLKALPGLEGPLAARLLDEADAVGAWTGDNIALVLFPTAETIKEVQKIADARPNALILLVNPQWSPDQGQVISDFGIFPWQKKAAADFIGSFQEGYAVQNLRINGDYVQWLYAYPAGWQVCVLQGPGQSQCILQGKEKPSYKEVEAKLRSLPWSMSSKGLMERIQAEAEFNRKSVQGAPPPQE